MYVCMYGESENEVGTVTKYSIKNGGETEQGKKLAPRTTTVERQKKQHGEKSRRRRTDSVQTVLFCSGLTV